LIEKFNTVLEIQHGVSSPQLLLVRVRAISSIPTSKIATGERKPIWRIDCSITTAQQKSNSGEPNGHPASTQTGKQPEKIRICKKIERR